MTPLQAIVLALIQGVTEFLPISSSAHLILVPYVLGWQEHDLRFEVVTNAGTLLAAVVYFRRDLAAAWRYARATLERGSRFRPTLGPAVLVASVPVLVVGLLGYGWFATAGRRPALVAFMSIAFGLLLWWADRAGTRARNLAGLGWRDSAAIGLAQAIALVPGTSRSGITITAGLALGFTREDAARFSFLLAIPVGLAAFAKDAFDLANSGAPGGALPPLVLGFLASAISAYVVIGWLLAWLRSQNLTPFVAYRVLLGALILVLTLGRG